MYLLKNFLTGAIILIAAAACSSTNGAGSAGEQPSDPHSFASLITEDFLREQLYTFAGDDFEGRGTGQAGIEIAADYIVDFYREYGVLPLGDEGSYFQHFNLASFVTRSVQAELTSTAQEEPVTVYNESFSATTTESDFYRLSGGGQDFEGSIVFAGFGVTDEARAIDHLGEMDLTDKWVMVYSDIPFVVDGDTLVNPGSGGWQRVRDILFNRAAGGLIFIRSLDEDSHAQDVTDFARLMGIPSGFSLPGNPPRGRFSVPVMSVSPQRAASMLGADDGLEAHYASLTASIDTFEPVVLDYSLSVTSDTEQQDTPVKNIVGLIEGSHPELKNEYIVISAHYDHLGFSTPDATGDFIYNGADDNGSGSVNILAQAKALMAAKEAGAGPDRSIILLHVTAEEVGLLGSRYYSDNPTVPIEQIIANINTDMMGRVDDTMAAEGTEDYVYIIGAEIISSDLNNRLMEASEIRGNNLYLSMRFNDLDDRNQFYRRSDHWNFGRLGIPFIFFFSGVHADYHQASDSPDKITYGPYTKRVQLIYSTVIQLANHPEVPVVDSQEFIRRTQVSPR